MRKKYTEEEKKLARKITVKKCNDKRKNKNKEYYKEHKEEYKRKSQKYYDDNKEKIKEKNREYYYNNKEKALKQKKKYYSINKEICLARNKNYCNNNKEKIKSYNKNYNVIRNLKKKERIKIDPLYDLKIKIRKLIWKSFRSKKLNKNKKTIEILGCSFCDFKVYLENKFEPWMNWNNRGLYNGEFGYGWDIDHIIPLSSAKTEEDIIKLNHFSNLQPLCSKTNRDIKRNELYSELS